jgi:hypothetical protein
MIKALWKMLGQKTTDVPTPPAPASEREYEELRFKMRREATNLSLANKIVLRSVLFDEMIGTRKHPQNDSH